LVDLYNRRKKEVDELAALTGWSPANGSGYIREYNKYLNPRTKENLRNEGVPAFIKPNTLRGALSAAVLLLLLVSVFAISRKPVAREIR
jgi:hypothetical protein